MPMPVMQVRVVNVPVNERSVPMHVRVRLARRIVGIVLVLMMGVVNVAMLVNQLIVLVFVFVAFG